jgi:hypothetical protein
MTTKSMTVEIPPKEAARLGSFLKQFVAAVDQAKKQMSRDQAEIDRLKAETRALLVELKAIR